MSRICVGDAAYERISSTWVALTWRSPLATLTSTMKNTINITIVRRGVEVVDENMLLSTGTRTMIGIALRATASGVTISSRKRNRISTNANRTPRMTPPSKP